MKKFLSIVFILLSVQVFAQTNPITAINITLPTNPDANTANWGTGTSLLMISATAKSASGRVDPILEESRLLVLIKQNGKTVCGAYTNSSAPQAGFTTLTKVWSGGNAASFIGKDCILLPGDYEISVQFFGSGPAGTIPLSDEKTKPFTIKGNELRSCDPPHIIFPLDNTAFKQADLAKPVRIRWMASLCLNDKQNQVGYQVNAYQLRKGQTYRQAINASQLVFTKDVKGITETVISNLISGPCDPPMICDFVITVQALDADGKPLGLNNGTSDPVEFSYAPKQETIKNPVDSGTAMWDLCKRRTRTWAGIAAELNKISNCAVPYRSCTYDQIVTIPADDFVFWSGNDTHVFSQLEQNNLIATAKNWALNHRPVGCNNTLKSVIAITYTTTLGVSNDDEVNNKVILFSVKYGCCTGDISQGYQQRVDLVSPVMNLNPGETKPTFQWAVNNPQPGETYTVKLVETDENQSPEEAIKTKSPVFEQSGVKEPGLAYPPSAKPLDPGKTYIWGVTVSDRGGKQLDGTFTKLLPLHTPLGPYNYCNKPVNITPNPVIVCQGQPATIQISSTISGYSWQILGPGGFSQSGTSSGTTQAVTFTPSSLPGTYTVNISKTVVINIPPFHFYQYYCGTGSFTVNQFPVLTATIDQAQICNGQAAMLSIPNLPSGYTINWAMRDGCGPTGSGAWLPFLSGNYLNTNAISPSCPAVACTTGQTYVTRHYMAMIVPIGTGTAPWPAACFNNTTSIKVWCPTAAGNITGASDFCIDPSAIPPLNTRTVTLNYAGGTYTTINWAGPSGPLGNNISQVVTVGPNAGSYTFTATVQNGTSCNPITKSVTIKVENPLHVTITGNNSSSPIWVCPDDNVVLTAHSTPAVPFGSTYLWEYNVDCQLANGWHPTGVNSSTQNTNSIAGITSPYSPIPTTSLCWRVTITTPAGICGPNVSPNFTINIFQPPCTPVITAAGAMPKCPGSAVVLNTQAGCGNSTTGPLTWQWYLNGIAVPGATSPSYSATLPGSYKVEVKNQCESETRISAPFAVTDCINVITIKGPCSAVQGSQVTLTAYSANPPCWGTNNTYQWYVNGTAIAGATGAVVQVAPANGASTTYSVTVTSATGCQASASIAVKVCQ